MGGWRTESSLRVRGTALRDAQSSVAARSSRSERELCNDPALLPHERCDPNPAVSSTDRNSYLLYIRSGSGARPGDTTRTTPPAAPLTAFPVNARVIPACAGNSRGAARRSGRVSGHPCVCGEQGSNRPSSASLYGSSLRVRGAVFGSRCGGTHIRVIPACAGNSLPWVQTPSGIPGHPCACGEQDAFRICIAATGSSLRVRGTVVRRVPRGRADGVIPACAGNRCAWIAFNKPTWGSSLRVRGAVR